MKKYSVNTLEKLRNYLSDGQTTREYEILVDDIRAVSRTNDPEQFWDFETLLDSDTEVVALRIYYGTSRRYEEFKFAYGENPAPAQTISMDEVQARIEEALKRQATQSELEQLRKDCRDLEEANKKWVNDYKSLEADLEVLKKRGLHVGDVHLGELAGYFVRGYVEKNPGILAKIPGGEVLEGLALAPKPNTNTEDLPDEGFEVIHADEHQDENLAILQKLRHSFDENGFKAVMGIMAQFCETPAHVPLVWELLNENKPLNHQNHANL